MGVWGNRKKKPWRKIRTRTEIAIRRFCITALALESAWGIKSCIQTGVYEERQVIERAEDGKTGTEEIKPGFQKSIYGITIQRKDGEIQIYRQDEYWKEEADGDDQ